MGQALYRKYRSKTLDEIVGQDHITRTLASAVKSGRIAHAYLFTGPRGVGKTSIARILAHNINGLPYTDDSSHIDIIEIDAASNRKLEETKGLIEKVYVAPVSAKYKVYIIDEVHMLTPESFNALLKTLEEPPAHVVFILATTDAHKLPETIISRTQRFQFRPIETAKVTAHLKQIAKQEKIEVEDRALDIIAFHGNGSFRDSIGLLDQSANYAQPITVDSVNSLLGIPSLDLLDKLSEAISSTDSALVMSTLHELYDQGYPGSAIASQLSQYIRNKLVEGKTSLSRDATLNLLAGLLDVPGSQNQEQFLEICLLRCMPAEPSSQHNSSSQPKDHAERPSIEAKERKAKTSTAPIPAQIETKIPKAKQNPKTPTDKYFEKVAWQDVLNLLKSRYNTLYGIVRMASIDNGQPGVVILKFAFPFHQKRVNDAKNRQIIQDAIKQVSGNDYVLECIVDKDLLTKNVDSIPEEPTPELETINSIFGGGEVVE